MRTPEEREAHQIAISELADKYLDEELRQGEPFTEALCNYAVNKAEQELGSL